jgi:hypothetical protein
VDFDGTIVENKAPEIGELLPHCFYYLSEFKARGAKIYLWTCRSGARFNEAVHFVEENIFLFDDYNFQADFSPKIYADVYIDDKALGCPLSVSSLSAVRGKPYVNWEIVGPAVLARMDFKNYEN